MPRSSDEWEWRRRGTYPDPPGPPAPSLQTEMSRLMWLHCGSKETHTHTPTSHYLCRGGEGGAAEHQMRQNEGCRGGGENRWLSAGVPAEVCRSVPLVSFFNSFDKTFESSEASDGVFPASVHRWSSVVVAFSSLQAPDWPTRPHN